MKSLLLSFLVAGIAVESLSQIVLNEILNDPVGTDTGAERIEILNLGPAAVDLTGYDLYPDGIGYFTFASFVLSSGALVVVHLRESGANTGTDLYHDSPTANMGNSNGSVALFNSTTHGSSTLVSFVQWGSGNQAWSSAAVAAGKWSAGSDFISAVAEGHSLEYDGSGYSSGDWFDQQVPTIGEQNALPVQLVSFCAVMENDGVVLSWETVSEIDNYGFDIERRDVDVRQSLWHKIGFVQGEGTTHVPHRYRFVDGSVRSGRHAYRLKQLDHSGGVTFTDEVEIQVGRTSGLFFLEQNHPNPFNPSTRLFFTVPSTGRVLFRVFDLRGALVSVLFDRIAEAGEVNAVEFDGSHLPSGVYIAACEFAGSVMTRRMVLLK